jgi:hypothetical protein
MSAATAHPPASEQRRVIETYTAGLPRNGVRVSRLAVSNQAILGSLQRSLRVGRAGDRFEQEADAVADRVMAMPDPKPSDTLKREVLQHQPVEGEEEELVQPTPSDQTLARKPEEEEEELQAKPAGGSGRVGVDAPTVAAINSQRGSGSALPAGERSYFESRFGRGFGDVRVHTGDVPAVLARRVNARAFTVGRDVFFGARQWRPGTVGGRRLLAHELTHVTQQRSDRALRRQEQEPGDDRGRAEPAEAEAASDDGDPCGDSSLAAEVRPTPDGVTVTLGRSDFGRTSRLAAGFGFAACRTGGSWRFHLNSLRVPVGIAIRPAEFRIEVSDGDASVVTAETYGAIATDLAPNRSVTAQASCRSDTETVQYRDPIPNYSRRSTYWKRQLVVDHENYHKQDWMEKYRARLVAAERQVWTHALPTSSASNATAAVAAARSTLAGFMISAYQAACREYAPHKESRAYEAGAADYQTLVDAVRARAVSEGWTGSDE